MSFSVIKLFFRCTFLLLTVNGQSYNEKHRLQLHYSPPSGWANDPNGLIYAGEYYHLFYQSDPANITNDMIHWGHARSKDLIHWENFPVALKPVTTDQGLTHIFSGCCVIDKDNLTGLAKNESEVLLAIYTHHDKIGETQAMSYSFDNGITWTQYDGNPIIKNPGVPDFRDPNVIERNGVYYMALSVHDRISFYSSKNLISWKPLSSFGVQPNEGDKTGVWECPSLISLKDEHGKKHDILIVSENGDKNGSLTQYFIGDFDGAQFKSYNQSDVLWIDNGFDNYAAVPWHSDPKGRAVIIGWMSNWLYAHDIPNSIWRGQFTIPRELSLKTINGKIYVSQQPVDELNSIVDPLRKWSLSEPIVLRGKQVINLTEKIPFKTGSMLEMEYILDIGNVQDGMVNFRFGNNIGEFVSFGFNITTGIYRFNRCRSSNIKFNKNFSRRVARAARISDSNLLSGRVILDVASIEIFADDGLNTFSSIFFPTEPFENIKIISNIDTSESIQIQEIHVGALRSIWK